MKPAVQLAGKRVLLVGLERTGAATALFCLARGAHVTVTEQRPEPSVAEAAAKLRAAGVTLELGGHHRDTFLAQDLIIPSPGVPLQMEHLEAARAQGIVVWSEIELAWRFLHGRLIAVTGSNGKTTTTSLIGHILRGAEIPVQVGGNIGTPLISLVDASSESSVTVAEVSSFQLEAIEAFRPDVAVMLNLTPDHLDRHGSFEVYARAKERLFENQREHDSAVLNADDPQVTRRAPSRPQVFWFSRQKRVAAGVCLTNQHAEFRRNGEESILLCRDDIPLKGEHNVENVLAAAAAAFLVGAEPAAIASQVRSFPGVEHRLEFVAEVAGVSFYNDSKATNVDATVKALEAFPGNLLVILGGRDKGGDFTALREPLTRHARLALLIGEAAQKIAAQLGDAISIKRAGTLEAAVHGAFEQARPGDTVLLAPACASFDQFRNFEHRGRVFKEVVSQLVRQAASFRPAVAGSVRERSGESRKAGEPGRKE